MGDGMSIADAFALMKGNDGDGAWGGNGGFMWIFFLFFLLAWGGNGFGWGGRNGVDSAAMQGALTRADLVEGFDNQSVLRKLDGITQGICDSTYALNNSIRDLGVTTMQGFNATDRELCAIGRQLQECCCATQKEIVQNRYENQKNTCDIITAIHNEGEATRALINQNTVQELRDRLEARDRDLIAANFQISQQAQTANIINTVRPFPQPAYVTCSPYQSVVFPTNNCGCGCQNTCCQYA